MRLSWNPKLFFDRKMPETPWKKLHYLLQENFPQSTRAIFYKKKFSRTWKQIASHFIPIIFVLLRNFYVSICQVFMIFFHFCFICLLIFPEIFKWMHFFHLQIFFHNNHCFSFNKFFNEFLVKSLPLSCKFLRTMNSMRKSAWVVKNR